MSKAKFILSAVLAGAMTFGVASAHHAVNSQFDVTKQVELKGVLTKFDNLNPHCYWFYDVTNAQGAIEHWAIESVAPNAWRRSGLKFKEDVIIGKTYTFFVAPGRDPTAKIGLMLGIQIGDKTITPDGPP